MLQKRLFISHSWRYGGAYEAMVRLLHQRPYFSWKNYSVPEQKAFGPMAKYRLAEELRQQIRPVQCVIIIGGMWTSRSDWIQFEMDFAYSLNKPIVGVRPWGSQRIPSAVSQKADIIVGWNVDSVVGAIRSLT